jgi:hypothetical protein
MTLENTLLQKLAETPPVGERHELTVSQGDWTAHLTYDRRDELSGRLWEAALHRRAPGAGDVETWAERIAGRVSGLLEPLKVVEVDAVKQEALLRSATPSAKGEHSFYYELRLRGRSHATFQRFQAAQLGGKKRVQVAYALTHETLGKLVTDLTSEK